MRIFQPLRSAPVALLWGGLSLSALGDQLYGVALSWIAVGLLGANAGYLTALQALALLLATLGVGWWADRRDQFRAMIGADLARAAVLFLVVGWWLAAGAASVPQLVAAVVVLAVGQAVFQPALQAVLGPLVADMRLLPAANGLLDATDRSARLIGPGVVALMAGLIPPVHFLTIDALSFMGSAVALMVIGRLRPGLPAVRRVARESILEGVVRGVRAMRGHPLLGYVLATSGAVNGAWYAVFYLGLPLMIEQQGVRGPGGTGLGAFGLVISAYGLTNLASTLVFGSRGLPGRPQVQMFGGTMIAGVGIVLLGCASLLPGAWVLPGLAGAAAFGAIGGPMKDIPLAVLRQTRLAAGDVGSGMRAYMVTTSAGTLAALLVAPVAYSAAGALPVVALCGATLMGVGVVGLLRHWRWVEAGLGRGD